jgi:pterin-4a-carbinolamine dehydratase
MLSDDPAMAQRFVHFHRKNLVCHFLQKVSTMAERWTHRSAIAERYAHTAMLHFYRKNLLCHFLQKVSTMAERWTHRSAIAEPKQNTVLV